MKCRNCNSEAVYDDGLCEACHRASQQGTATVMSRAERDSFRGQTIEEDGTVRNHEAAYEQDRIDGGNAQGSGSSGFRVLVSSRLPLRAKLALAVIVFCILAVVVSALGFIFMAMPYLLGIFFIYVLYSVVKSLLRR